MEMRKGFVVALGALWAVLRSALPAWGQEAGRTTTGGGLDTWTALFVVGVLVIALGGLIIYEAVARRA